MLWIAVTIICTFAGCGIAGCQKKATEQFTVPPEEQARKNPFAASPEAIAEGMHLYRTSDCAICHGVSGNGKGVLAGDTSMNTHDWRDPASLASMTDGELFYILQNGKGRMPGYGRKETSDRMWHIIIFIRSLGGK